MKVKCIDNSQYPELLIIGKVYNVVGIFSRFKEKHYWIDNYEGYDENNNQFGVNAKFFEAVRNS